MPDLYQILKSQKTKEEKEKASRERQDQFKGVRKAERERVCKLIRENSALFWNSARQPMKEEWRECLLIKNEILEKIERGEL